MKYIVFGYDGRNTLGQIRSLGVKGIAPTIILVGTFDGVCEASRYCGRVHRVTDEQEGVNLLLSQYADNNEKAVIYTDSDGVVGALNANYNRLAPFFHFSNAGGQGRLNNYLEKMTQIELAKEFGFDVADSVVWNHGDPIPTIPYPIFTKASSSLKNGWKSAAHICKNEQELKNLLNCDVEAEGGFRQLLLQHYISKKDEIYFEGFSINKGKDVYIPLYGGYYRLEPTSYGTYEWLAKYASGPVFLQKLNNLFGKIGYEGIFEVEFILDDKDKLYFTEINFRETAFNHVHTLMGINLTWMYAQSLAKGYLCVDDANVIKEPFVFMNEFADFMKYVLKRKISIRQWIQDVRHSDAFIFYDRQDLKPFRHELKKYIKRISKGFINKVSLRHV